MNRLTACAATLLFATMPARAVVINALDHDGTDSHAVLSDVGHIRTRSSNDYVMGVIWNADTLTPGVDGTLIQFKRIDTDGLNHSIHFDDGGDRVCYSYSLDESACCGSLSANTWYLTALNYDVTSDTFTLRNFTLDGTQTCSNTLTPTTSDFSDGQTQEPSFGAYESGGTIEAELDGQSILQFLLYGVEKNQSQLSAYASDPLNTGDSWLSTHGTSVFRFWFDSTITCPASVCTDVTGNSETLTLSGGTTLGSSNGPDIPARSSGGNAAAVRRRHQRRHVRRRYRHAA